MPGTKPHRRRCAIYTRKSSEEGLEQAFNSLDAQRDACEAYARSQRHEGWVVLPAHYDDGGISGGTLERPALQRLLADIRAGQVDLVLVYKVDRLTRSLADFARIVDVFDAHGASFVSVTQHFNTATSMGRLTLNMLLSFAQFEREVAGERIRDKIAASKRKGMWMGGTVPLGYRVEQRKLVVCEAEAPTVRLIFRRYLALGCVRTLRDQLAAEGICSRRGVLFRSGPLFHMLHNRIYRGEVAHKGNIYPGEHAAIIEAALWDAVQQRLAANWTGRRPGQAGDRPSLLAGLLFDGAGVPMRASHAVKGKRRYRYYVSRTLVTSTRDAHPDGLRLPAQAIEQRVVERIQHWLTEPADVLGALRQADLVPEDAAVQQHLAQQAAQLAQRWSAYPLHQQQMLLRALLSRVAVMKDRIDLHLNLTGLEATLRAASEASPVGTNQTPISLLNSPVERLSAETNEPASVIVSIPAALRRAGKEMALVLAPSASATPPDPSLVRLISKAHRLRTAVLASPDDSLRVVAEREGLSPSYASRLIRLAWLAPDIVTAILDGQQPPTLSATLLMQDGLRAADWRAQRTALGFVT